MNRNDNDRIVRPPTILSVDHDPSSSETIARIVRVWGIEVMRAKDVMQGLWKAATKSPDVVVAELLMPNGRGLDIIECLRQNSRTNDIPVVVLAGNHDAGVTNRLIELGVSSILKKPIHPERLLSVLAEHIQRLTPL